MYMKKYGIILLVIGLITVSTNAQYRINIPSVNVWTADTSNSGKEIGSKDTVGQLPWTKAGGGQTSRFSNDILLLDSMTYFDLVEVRVSHKPAGWYPRSYFKLKGAIPNRSALRILLKQKAKVLVNLRCEIQESAVSQCFDKAQVVKQIGLFDVDVSLINGDTDEETPLRKLKIDVRKTEKFNDYNDYFVNRHPDVSVAYLSLEGKNPWVMNSRADRKKGSNRLYLNTVISRDHLEKYNGGQFLRCKLDGQPFKLKNSDVSFDQKEGSVFVTYESRHKTGSRKGAINKDYLKFALQQIQLPLSMGGEDNRTNDVSKVPGDWACSISSKADRELIREFRFTVDASGQIVPHPEQQNGNVVFGEWEWMIDMEIPAGGSPMDHRLLPSPQMGFFHGIPWSTPEGKAMAGRVPKKGVPFPVAAK
jgi:hypothetical protein